MNPIQATLKKIDFYIRDLNHRRIDFFRHWRVVILKRLLDKPSLLPPNQSKDLLPLVNLGDLVLIRLDDKLGDSVTSTGFIKTLLQIKTKGDIVVVTRPGAAVSIFQQFPQGVKVVTVEKGLWPAFKLLKELATKNISVLINTSHILTPETILLFTQLEATVKISFGKNEFRNFTHYIERTDANEHVTAKYEKTLKLFSPYLTLEPYCLSVIPERYRAINLHLNALTGRLREVAAKSLGIDADTQDLFEKKVPVKKIVLNSFAGAKLRNFSKEKTIEMIQGLSRWALENKKAIQIISLANQGDQKILNEWFYSYQQRSLNPSRIAPPPAPHKNTLTQNQQNYFPTALGKAPNSPKGAATPIPQISFIDLNPFSHWVRLPQVFTWDDNVALLNCADLVITPDTSIVHVASALKKSVIAVYREDTDADKNQKHWAPRYTEFQIIEAGYDRQRPFDINSVSVREVIEAVELFL